MKLQNILILISFFICNVKVSICQSLDNEKKIYQLIEHIDDSSLEACLCWLAVHPHSSIIPSHQLGVEYAISIETSIDSSLSACSTISKNDCLFILNEEDMKNIKKLYKEWYYFWQKDSTITKRALDGTKYRWVNLKSN